MLSSSVTKTKDRIWEFVVEWMDVGDMERKKE